MLAPRSNRVVVAGVVLGLALLLGVASPAFADPCPGQASLPAAADTWIVLATGPYATATTLEVRTWPDETVARAALLQFDLAAIPAGATLQGATLKLTLVDADAEAAPTYHVGLHQVINVVPNLALATGNTYDGTHSWTNQLMGQGDIAAEAAGLDVDKTLGAKTWDATAIVAAWLAQPGTNYGFLLNADKTVTGTRWRNFASLEHATAAARPVLDVTWCVPDDGGTPEDGGVDAGAGDAGGDASPPPSDATADAPASVDGPTAAPIRPVIGWTCAAGGSAGAGASGAGLLLLLGVALARTGRLRRTARGRGHRAVRCWRRLLLLCLTLATGALPAVAAAQREPTRLPLLPAAQARLDRGVKLYGERRFDEAVREFAAGYDVDPRPEFLYALGQAHRAKGDCGRATDFFFAFLRTAPPPAQQEKARVQLARCERARMLAAASAPTAPPATPAADPVLPSGAHTPTVVAALPPPRGVRLRLMLDVAGLGEVVGRTGALEVGARAGLGAYLDLGAAALVGEHTGARMVVGFHPARRRALNPSIEARGVVHPVAGAVALGGGLWLGATWELGPGRLRAGAAAELFTAPAGYRGYAVLLGGGYQLDVLKR